MADEKDKRTDEKAGPRTGAGGGDPAGKPAGTKREPPSMDCEYDPWAGAWVPKRRKR